MKYIKKVILENFQSHKYTIIEFDRRLNTIVGASDSGKTSILRGIKWALYNDPSGDYFIREGTSECSVTVFFSDNTKIKRYRSKSKNIYFVYDRNDNEIKYEGFGTSVPDEVISITGIKKILLDKDTSKSINISDQLEGAFLLSEKNSVKANSIGYLVGVDVIDDALRDTLKDSKNLSAKQKDISEDINNLKKELGEYKYLEDVNKKIKKMDEIRIEIDNKTKILNKYKQILNNKIFINKEKEKVNYYINKLKYLHKIQLSIKKIELSHNRLKLLSNHSCNFKKIRKNKIYNTNLLNYLKDIDKLNSNINAIDKLQIKQSNLSKLNLKLKRTIIDKKEINIKLHKLSVLNIIIPSISKIENNIIELESLDKLKIREIKVLKSLNIGNEYVKKLKTMNLSEDKYDILNKKIKTSDVFTKLNSNYIDNKDKKDKCNIYLLENKKTINILSSKYKKMLLSQRTCPLCFSEIDNKKADYIINQYK